MADVDALQLVNERGWRRGFTNLLRKENTRWWHTRRWLVQSLIWLVIINGTLAIVLWVAPIVYPEISGSAIDSLPGFFELMILLPMFSVIIGVQGTIIDEKLSGTAAWIMSAPVSRAAFILAKLFADAFGYLVTIILLQGLVAYVQISLAEGNLLPPVPYLANLGMLSLYLLFYLTLTLMLGTFFDNRGPVLAISIGVALASLKGIAPLVGSVAPWAVYYLPETLPALVRSTVTGGIMPPEWPITVIAMILFSELFVALAIWRFRREEF
jgi:ABC-2 type transport system permease protein